MARSRIHKEVVQRYIDEGYTSLGIATALGTTIQALCNWSNRNGVRLPKRRSLTAEYLHAAKATGMTITDICGDLNITYEHVRRQAVVHNIILPGMMSFEAREARRQALLKPKVRLVVVPPSQPTVPTEPPPSPAMVALAPFDSIARRAVNRKLGRVDWDDGLPADLDQVSPFKRQVIARFG